MFNLQTNRYCYYISTIVKKQSPFNNKKQAKKILKSFKKYVINAFFFNKQSPIKQQTTTPLKTSTFCNNIPLVKNLKSTHININTNYKNNFTKTNHNDLHIFLQKNNKLYLQQEFKNL